MRAFDRFSDAELSLELARCASHERISTAEFIACIEEFDRRRLYLPAGFSSMHQYCVFKLGLSEDAASRRMRAARAVRDFPVLLEALADCRLHLSGVSLLAPHLNAYNFQILFDGAVGKTKREIEELIAWHFPQSESLPLITAIPTRPSLRPSPASNVSSNHQTLSVPGRINADASEQSFVSSAPAIVRANEPEIVDPDTPNRLVPEQSVRPIAAERYAIHVTVSASMRDKLEYAQALLSHSIPSGDLAEVFERALDSLITAIEKRRFAEVESPRSGSSGTHGRTISAEVRRAVWRRDRGRCTFVGDDGHRCDEWRFLEFDHVDPVAFGGLPAVEGVRLRCRAHNQYEAERALGQDFMARRRGS